MQKRDFFKCNDYFTHLRKHCQLKYVCKPFQLLKGPPVILYFFFSNLILFLEDRGLILFLEMGSKAAAHTHWWPSLLTPIPGRRGGGRAARSSRRPGGRQSRRQLLRSFLLHACNLPPAHHQPWKPPRPDLALSAMEALRSDVEKAAMKGASARTSPAAGHGGWSRGRISPPHCRPWRSLVELGARRPQPPRCRLRALLPQPHAQMASGLYVGMDQHP
jgi:hypothetical protein